MKDIKVNINNHEVGNLFFEKEKNQYGFNYTQDFKPISLIMPYKTSSYIWHYKLHPIFDMNMPEGYLFEIFKKYLTTSLMMLSNTFDVCELLVNPANSIYL